MAELAELTRIFAGLELAEAETVATKGQLAQYPWRNDVVDHALHSPTVTISAQPYTTSSARLQQEVRQSSSAGPPALDVVTKVNGQHGGALWVMHPETRIRALHNSGTHYDILKYHVDRKHRHRGQ